jgi:hypothetical protein
MAKVVVKDNHLNFGGVTYFRGHAEEVEIGSYGEKRTPITKMNYLEVKGRIPVPKIDVATSTVVDIDFSQTSKSAFNTTVSAIVQGIPVKFSGDATFEKLKKGELKLVKFSVLNNAMKEAANNSPKAIDDLINYGNDARIAHQVFVVMEASLATKFDNNVTADLSVGGGALQATVNGSHAKSGETTVKINAGTGFAYLLVKVDWDAKQKKNKTKIVDLDDDQWSFS